MRSIAVACHIVPACYCYSCDAVIEWARTRLHRRAGIGTWGAIKLTEGRRICVGGRMASKLAVS
jgi:hypothetical protein